jgi:G:T/U-mismatch repair DNA glycosylase
MLVIGHNPSEHSWASGWSYSNPSNNFWRLLVKGAIVPEDWSAEDCPRLPGELGVGFTDAGCVPGSDAARFGRATMREWRADLYARLRGHLCRASGYDFGDGDDDTEDAEDAEDTEDTVPVPGDDSAAAAAAAAAACGYGPAIVAFAGKRQYGQLFDAVPGSVRAGRQDPNSLPPGWPFCPESTEVWVLPSSSGRAAMTREAREGPYVELGRRLAELRWPRDDVDVGAGEGGGRGSRGDETNHRRGDDDASRCRG